MKDNHEFDYNLYLIGLSGTGKSTCGKMLSQKLNLIFIDLDKEIIKKEKTPISEIFLKKGEKYFRKIETSLLEKFSKKKNHIISTGGGIVESNYNMEEEEPKADMIMIPTTSANNSNSANCK